ncbi:hypothetical protein SD71_07155 [Cohnella kolymensis]|uniref:Uncharacterized protein n=1 Tax=Cohnella kolymensis TaxID=1590652 RepID=A0ABR5A6X7_9BACL|nr:hypothetical protein [Cohnella kolymensis]KIL36533.1 hypothetical protein SD71_07155 [Cohnella kolymensis]
METTTTDNNDQGTNEQRLVNLRQEADSIIAGIFEDDNISEEFLQDLKNVIMTYLDDDSLIQVDVENLQEGTISCSVYSEDGVHKFLYESDEEWGAMFFGRDEIDNAFYILNELDVEEIDEVPIQ